MKLVIYLPTVPTSRMSGVIPLHPTCLYGAGRENLLLISL